MDYVKGEHDCFEIDSAGLYVNPESPHLGASPDGLISCKCCGPGLLEIKCPFSVRDTIPTSIGYIKTADDGVLRLCENHNYYFQIQGQMAIFDRSYCDFVCWTPCGMYVERIPYDANAVNWMLPKLDAFFLDVILPIVLCYGKETAAAAAGAFCFCRRGESGRMIACDSPHCEYTWFHYSCLNLPSNFEPAIGAGDWLCPECAKKSVHLPH